MYNTFEEALKKHENKLKERQQEIHDLKYYDIAIQALTPYIKYKRLNQTHIKEINESLKGSGYWVNFGPRQYFESQYRFSFGYETVIYERNIRTTQDFKTVDIELDKLNAVEIIKGLQSDHDRFRDYLNVHNLATIEQVKQLYIELELLMKEHEPYAEKALSMLFTRL